MVLRLHISISVALEQKTANFTAAIDSRVKQCIRWTETSTAKESTGANRVSLHENNNNNKRQLPVVVDMHISVVLEQKTANFKVAIANRVVQYSASTVEERQKNHLAA